MVLQKSLPTSLSKKRGVTSLEIFQELPPFPKEGWGGFHFITHRNLILGDAEKRERAVFRVP